jgi:hypothetical protein
LDSAADLGGHADLLDRDSVHNRPPVLAVAVPAGEAFCLCQCVKDFHPGTAAVGVEVGDVKFLYGLVFHKSSVQPGSDILWNQLRVLPNRRTRSCASMAVRSALSAARTACFASAATVASLLRVRSSRSSAAFRRARSSVVS